MVQTGQPQKSYRFEVMRLQIQRNDLLGPLQKVIGAIEKRQTMPMLGNVLIEVDGGRARFTATDLEIMLRASIAYPEAGDAEAAAVPARKLLDICKALPEGSEVVLEANGERGVVRAGNSRFTLVCLPPSDYPTLDTATGDSDIVVPAETLRTLLEKTSFAMANQDVRYYLNGLMLELYSRGIRAVATDGHRLTMCQIEAQLGSFDASGQVIVPRKGVLELQRLLADEQGDVSMSMGTRHLRVEAGNDEFVSKLIDGKFPDYQRVIPTDAGNRLTVDRKRFREALQRAAILSNEKYRGIRLVMEPDLLTLEAHNSEQEEAEERLEVEYEGADLSIGFNVQYLLDVTNVMTGEQLVLALKDANSSALLTDPEDPTAKYVIMPMRL